MVVARSRRRLSSLVLGFVGDFDLEIAHGLELLSLFGRGFSGISPECYAAPSVAGKQRTLAGSLRRAFLIGATAGRNGTDGEGFDRAINYPASGVA